MLRLAAVLLLAPVLAQAEGPVRAAAAQAPAQSAKAPWLDRLASYLEAVNEHRPGMLDMPARITGFMGEGDLYEVGTDLFALVALCKRELGRSASPGPVAYRDTVIPYPDLRRLLGLTDEEAAKGNANRILQRAAILHADVAMLVAPFLPGRTGCSSRSSLLVLDGGGVGSGCISIHWLHGRLLLDAVRPDPGKDAVVRLWYVATLTYLLESGDFASAEPHIARARLLFPDDPAILFEHGFFHEGYAGPLIQTAALESGMDTRGAKVHLDEAEDLYRRAVRENPQFVEARVRHGRVLGLLGRHRDAAGELRIAAASAAGPTLRYFAELFLAQEEAALGNHAEARDHYRQASTLFPQAQSPLIGLSLLARQLGDRAGAQDALQRMLALPSRRSDDGDPWWTYHRAQNQDFKSVFAQLHAPFLAGGRQ